MPDRIVIENERRFLVEDLTYEEHVVGDPVKIWQFYLLHGDAGHVRLRMIVPPNGCVTCKLQTKLFLTPHRGCRTMVETPEVIISSTQALELIGKCSLAPVHKHRYELRTQEHVMGIVDVFQEALQDLVIAEFEVDLGANLEVPGWVGQEVTHDRGWDNLSLALRGRP